MSSGNAKNERLDIRAKRIHLANQLWKRGDPLTDDQLRILVEFYGNIHQRIKVLPERFGSTLIDDIRMELQRLNDHIRRKQC